MWANAQCKGSRNVRSHTMLEDKTISLIIWTFLKVLHFPSLLHDYCKLLHVTEMQIK